jgi:glycosyltransferase involved in cell wall biosynthesis
MRIVMFSINPIFPDVVTGGASKHLYHIAGQLGKLGNDVKILCAQSAQPVQPFTWAENVRVFPVLPFKLPFPQPYNIGGPNLALIVERVSEALQDADRFYIHDGEFLIPDVYEHIPTVVSFRDNVYPESVLGSYIGKADEVICVSAYSADIIKYTAGRFYPDLENRIHQVNNGIDFNHFKSVDAQPLADELGVYPEDSTILLHPHRPEPGKGLPETIMVADRLVHEHGLSKLRVLIPEWINSMVSAGESDFYDAMMSLMQELDVWDHFKFIPWLPNDRMPELYSLGDVTLCLGNIVEAFGNVAYESLACATPSVVSRVGVHRTLLPDDLIEKVHFGDIDEAVKKVLHILKNNSRVGESTRSFLREHMDFNRQVESYAAIITSCQKREPLCFRHPERSQDMGFILAPWCCLDGKRIYNDFHGTFTDAGELTKLLAKKAPMTLTDAQQAGISTETWQEWVDLTWIVPIKG